MNISLGPKVMVTAFYDATSKDAVAASMQDGLRHLSDHVQSSDGQLAATADMYREEIPAPGLLGRLSRHLPVAILPNRLANAGVAGQMLAQAQDTPWTGYRHLEIGPQGSQVTRHEATTQLSAAPLKQSLVDNMKAYPRALQLVYMFGHGLGSSSVAGLKADDLEGLKADALLLHSCHGNSWQTLQALVAQEDHPRLLIGAQTQIDDSWERSRGKVEHHSPMNLLLNAGLEKLDKTMTNQELADCILEPLRGHKNTNFFAIDLEAVRTRLVPALDKVADLTAPPADPAAEMPADEPAASQEGETVLHTCDLGLLINSLADGGRTGNENMRNAAREAQSALSACILGSTGVGAQKDLSGIYIEL